MVQLAHALHEMAVLSEVLGQRDHVGQRLSEMGFQIVDAGGVGPRPAQQAGPGGRAHRLLAIGAFEKQTGLRDPVDVRAVDVPAAVAAQFGSQVIDSDEQHIQPFRFGGCCPNSKQNGHGRADRSCRAGSSHCCDLHRSYS